MTSRRVLQRQKARSKRKFRAMERRTCGDVLYLQRKAAQWAKYNAEGVMEYMDPDPGEKSAYHERKFQRWFSMQSEIPKPLSRLSRLR